MGKMFDLLKEGLEEALEYHRRKVQLRTNEVFFPDMPKDYKAEDIKKLRRKLKFSQSALATWLNVSLNTVQAWEQGARNPSQVVLRLLEIFDKGFSSIEAIYKSKPVTRKKEVDLIHNRYKQAIDLYKKLFKKGSK
jgi:putative transcriptional regulator